jgi:hypothetical protein
MRSLLDRYTSTTVGEAPRSLCDSDNRGRSVSPDPHFGHGGPRAQALFSRSFERERARLAASIQSPVFQRRWPRRTHHPNAARRAAHTWNSGNCCNRNSASLVASTRQRVASPLKLLSTFQPSGTVHNMDSSASGPVGRRRPSTNAARLARRASTTRFDQSRLLRRRQRTFQIVQTRIEITPAAFLAGQQSRHF